MRIRQALILVSVGVAGLALTGCELYFREPPVRASVYVGPQEPEYITVREAPPPFIVEERPPPPSDLYIWIGGYWHWNGRYVWERGRWAVPPHDHAVWIAPRYERHEQGYRYAPPHWKVEQREEKREDARGRSGEQRQDRQDGPDRRERR